MQENEEEEDMDVVGEMEFNSNDFANSARSSKMKHRNVMRGANITSDKILSNSAKRQRMPFEGGYGGMFAAPVSMTQHTNNKNNSHDDHHSEEGSNDGSSVSSAFSLASRFFTGSTASSRSSGEGIRGAYRQKMKRKSSSLQPDSDSDKSLPQFIITIFHHYLRLPFRLRYFIQLFSITGVFMLASLNYFIAMEIGPKSGIETSQSRLQQLKPQQHNNIVEGGGASPNQIPRLRVRSPFDLLHHDIKANWLFEKATTKLRQSTKFGDTYDPNSLDGQLKGGPFAYGWKSMPRQIFNDFPTGLSDDTQTIGHPNEVKKNQMGSKVSSALDALTGRDDADMKPLHQSRKGDELGGKLPAKGTVAYVLPVTTCYPPSSSFSSSSKVNNSHPYSPNQPRNEATFRDFAIMLRAMIHAHSYSNPASGSMYDYKMHAIIHPNAKKCRSDESDSNSIAVDRSVMLQNLGYHVSIEESPISASSIEGSEYLQKFFTEYGKDSIEDPSVDLIRLHAYELEGYVAAVLVDYDTLVLGAADEVFDLITDNNNNGGNSDNGNTSIDAVFSWEHVPSLINPQARASVVNLSFLVIRPSKETYAKIITTYETSPFVAGKGWGTIGRGSFPGWMTTQGFLTYFYDEVANGYKVEMNRCSFGNTGEYYSSQLSLITNGGKLECSSSEGPSSTQCNDCSHSKLDDVFVADLSYCLAPWECGGGDAAASTLCRKFHKQWFGGRLQMEDVHPQIQKGTGKLCIDGQYQPMTVVQH